MSTTNKYDDATTSDTKVLNIINENTSSDASGANSTVDTETDVTRSRSVRKRVAVAAGSVAVLTIGGCLAWAAGLFNTEDTESVQVTVINDNTEDEDVIADGVATVSLVPIADGFDENSSPFIAHITGETALGEAVDYYHAVWGDGSTSTIELEQGEYEITWISAVNSDGSIYATSDIVTTLSISADDVEAVNETAVTEAGTTEDNESTDGSTSVAIEAEQDFVLVDADDVTDEDIEEILAAIEDAIVNGDDTLMGTNGSTIVEMIEETIAISDDTPDDTNDVASEETSSSSSDTSTSSSDNSSSSNNSSSNSSTSNNSTNSSSSSKGTSSSSSSSSSSNSSSSSSNSSSPSNGSTSNSSSNNSSSSSSSSSSNASSSSSSTHNHSWTITSAYYECKGCGAQFISGDELDAHLEEGTINRTTCTSYSTKHNYACSCGATKQDW